MNELPAKIEAHLKTTPLANSLTPLFCDTLRWGAPRGMTPQPLPGGAPGDRGLAAVPVAQLSGLRVFRVDWPEDRPPTVTARRAVQRALAPVHAEHLLCYVTRDGRQVAFVWPRKRPDAKTELRTLPYEVGSPARTTVERLAELAFRLDELGPTGQPPVGAVIDKLDSAFSVEAVTKQFYQEIANWYFWARDREEVVLPKDVETAEDRALFLIRLLTRLIFCWFLRKKRNPEIGQGLLPDALFEEQNIRELLKDASLDACTYYPAILQNLFFATLNTEMDKPGEPPSRRFIDEGNGRQSDDHMIHTLWRNARLLRDPEAFARLLRRVPFLNGGLFECLDERVQKGNSVFTDEVHIDGFSNDSQKHPRLPNDLFFGPNRIVDLSRAYGDLGRRRETVRPLLSILRSYNFTLAENTPLDPELLGHVFENLLAAYNPETGTVARKATGSFYTPRVVVDWMVDQALLIYLNKALDRANNAAADQPDPRLRHLLSWDDDMPAYTPVETEALIDAIDHLKVLDPACGSGAFPIGMLQKLVHILRKLDPDNRGWRRRQKAAIEQIESPPAREQARRAIERAFAHDNDDYGRKLYLIEKCLYGVDIQPIACQIAKLRFFIALIVDQSIDPNEANYGILPLPNLETRIVAADTLLGFRPGQLRLDDERVRGLEDELKQVRHDYFTARRYQDKKALRPRDRELCADLARALADIGDFTPYDTQRIAEWNPYNTNTHASFFDPTWMFGLRPTGDQDGGVFDIVIGTPPTSGRNSCAASPSPAAMASRARSKRRSRSATSATQGRPTSMCISLSARCNFCASAAC
jgi:adenine-specific DNA-methyltransferase